MQKYIILTPVIGGMGGAQMFVFNKAKYLVELGWDVVICYTAKIPVLIEGLSEYNSVFVPELAYGIKTYTTTQVKNIITKICDQIHVGLQDNIVIESHLCYLAFWGEAIAEKLRGKHVLNFLEEDVPLFSSKELSFFEYKLKRWECINAAEQSLKRLFKEKFKDEYNQYNHTTTFYCSNVTSDEIDDSKIIIPDSSTFNILSVGRLNKQYIQTMITELYDFAVANNTQNIAIVFVGGSPDGSIERYISSKFSILKNVKLYFQGYMFPIPLRVIKCADVAICTSNSVLVSYEQGVPTIAVDANDNYAIGIYGVNTQNSVFRESEPKVPIGEYVKQIYMGEISYGYNYGCNDQCDPFRDQIEFISKSSSDYKYFNIHDIYSCFENMLNIIKRLISEILTK